MDVRALLCYSAKYGRRKWKFIQMRPKSDCHHWLSTTAEDCFFLHQWLRIWSKQEQNHWQHFCQRVSLFKFAGGIVRGCLLYMGFFICATLQVLNYFKFSQLPCIEEPHSTLLSFHSHFLLQKEQLNICFFFFFLLHRTEPTLPPLPFFLLLSRHAQDVCRARHRMIISGCALKWAQLRLLTFSSKVLLNALPDLKYARDAKLSSQESSAWQVHKSAP